MENEIVAASEVKYDLTLARAPKQVLAEAIDASKALKSVVESRKDAVRFNGKQYLTFEDYQTLGRFYGITAKIVSTESVEFADVKGFLAKAEAINTQTGAVVSAAESMCLNDEPNWSKKPLFQLRSMAQTRAAGKSLRNVLAWVAVLAGYDASLAEEMTGDEGNSERKPIEPPKAKEQPKAGGQTVAFVPSEVSVKSGEKNGKTWTKFGVKSPEGDFYGTFSEEFGNIAQDAKENKTEVVISWEYDATKKYRNILTLGAKS